MRTKIVEARTIGECWQKCISAVIAEGDLFFDEDVKIKEILGLTVSIDKPQLADPFIAKYGDSEVIRHTLQKFSKGVVMPNRPFTYGERLYNKNGVDQIDWIINRLSTKRETKSATINLLNEGDNSNNLPCLTTIDVKIRQEKLNLQFFFRSQNIVGRQYANLLAIAKLQSDIAARLNLTLGKLQGYVASAHIYEYDFAFAQKIINKEDAMLRDEFYLHGPKSIRQNPNFK